jgi:hypothetical protein
MYSYAQIISHPFTVSIIPVPVHKPGEEVIEEGS